MYVAAPLPHPIPRAPSFCRPTHALISARLVSGRALGELGLAETESSIGVLEENDTRRGDITSDVRMSSGANRR